jgi:hypothetical protein
MPFAERVEELDREIRTAVARAVAELREELTERLRRTSDELLLKMEEIEPRLPDDLVSLADLGPLAEQEAATARRGAFAELRDSLAALDHARSQAEVLAALLAESGRFASRALLLLLRGGAIRGWGGRGFGDEQAVRALSLPLPAGGPWATLAAGHGTVALSAGDCAGLCSGLEAELPRDGVLVPLVLRDQVVAALYADRLGGTELPLEAVQTLVYAASQAIESLAFRERGSTPTLHLAAVEAAEEAAPAPPAGAGPEVPPIEAPTAKWPVPAAPPEPEVPTGKWEIPEVEEPEDLEPPSAAELGYGEYAEPAYGEPAYGDAAAYGEPAYAEPVYVAPAVEEPPAAAPVAEPAVELEAAAAEAAIEGPAAPVWGEPLEDEDTAALLEDTASMQGSPLEDAAAGGWRLEDAEQGGAAAAVAEPEAEAWGAPVAEPPAEEPPAKATVESPIPAEPATPTWSEVASAAAEAPRPAEPPRGERPVEWRTAATAQWAVPVEERPAPPPLPPEEAPAEPTPETTARIPGLSAAETVLVRTPFAEPAPPPDVEEPPQDVEPEPPPPAGPAQTVRISTLGPEVTPPTGLQGPGWAFATTRLQVSADDEAQHEEARRLARLLVSEIKLYNEEQVDEGRRNRDLYERLKEDIDRSRQMYEERTDQRILNTTDYFYQELVRILAAGDSKALGI